MAQFKGWYVVIKETKDADVIVYARTEKEAKEQALKMILTSRDWTVYEREITAISTVDKM